VKKRTKLVAVFVLVALPVFACTTFFRVPQLVVRRQAGMPLDANLEGVENGERIYFMAVDSQGNPIRYRGGPDFGGMMMGSYLTCASCHGPGGDGGTHFMHMQVMDAPAIRYPALAEEAEEHGGDENSDMQSVYSLDDFRRAVVDGEHPDGEALSREMPRWQFSDQDLEDLFQFIKSLP
jgi:hypothetical protein